MTMTSRPLAAEMARDHLPTSRAAEHSMAMPAIRRRWTASAVRALWIDERAWPRYELIDGELIVTPAPKAIHQVAVGEIFALIHEYLEREPLGVVFTSPADLELEPDSITQPDALVIQLPELFARI